MQCHRQAGLTLVELMVVLLLLGLLSSAIVLTLPREAGRLEAEAALLAARLDAAARRSVIGGETIGVMIDDAGYSLLRLRAGRWTSSGVERHAWSAPVAFVFEPGGPASGPVLRFDAAGIATAFRLRLERNGERAGLVGDADGRVRMEAGDV